MGHEINLVGYESIKKHTYTRGKSAIEEKIPKYVACLKGKYYFINIFIHIYVLTRVLGHEIIYISQLSTLP